MWRDASRADQDTQGPGHLGVRWLIPLVCVLVLGLFLGLRSNLEMAVPLGSDAAMQGLLAMGLIRGEPPQVASISPSLVVLAAMLRGLPVGQSGSPVSVVSVAALPVVVNGAARYPCAGRWPALSAALGARSRPALRRLGPSHVSSLQRIGSSSSGSAVSLSIGWSG